MDLQKFTQDLISGQEKVYRATRSMKDGGSANYDCAAMSFKRYPHPSTRAKIKAAVEAAGLGCSWFQHDKTLRIYHKLAYSAQGAPHTVAAEVLTKHLREAGWENVYTHYRID